MPACACGTEAMRGFALFLTVMAGPALGGCLQLTAAKSGDRIVSIDYCADQMLLGLVEPERIAAVSHQIDSDRRFANATAAGIARTRTDAESLIALRPTLVVQSYGGNPRLSAALQRAKIATFTLPYAASANDVDAAIAAAGEAMNAQRQATLLRRRWQDSWTDARRLATRVPRRRALYMTPGDVTTGPDSFVAGLIAAAGFATYDGRPGWNRLPLEGMVRDPPDIVIRAFFDSPAYQQDQWSSARHAIAERLTAQRPTVDLDGGDIACNNWRAAAVLDTLADHVVIRDAP